MTVCGNDVTQQHQHANTHLYLKRGPSEKMLVLGVGGAWRRKNVWCSTHDFHRFLHER